ncbi:5-carboxymethyl-2-hydroxymuconate isomerase [Cupriavidus sp. SK-4]|nr:5-carboxymethyl-2-hydroxymuconate isomerase [Cupriavidus sp. SK-4]
MDRLAAFDQDGVERAAAVDDEGRLLPLPTQFGDVLNIVQGGEAALAAAAEALRADPPAPLEAGHYTLLAPIRRFRRDILCTGWNYWDHFEEGVGKREGQEVDRPAAPTFFTKGPDTVIGPDAPIAWDPRVSGKWDYEAEIVTVIGKDGRSIPAARAMDHVWGYCLANDVSQRDLQRRHGGQWLKGKSIDQTMPMGPWLTRRDAVQLDTVRLWCDVNGERMQNASAAQMAFPLAELIAELSMGMTLRAGDILLTGTPAGVGHARMPPRFLVAGDEVVVGATGLGRLRNRLAAVDLSSSRELP